MTDHDTDLAALARAEEKRLCTCAGDYFTLDGRQDGHYYLCPAILYAAEALGVERD